MTTKAIILVTASTFVFLGAPLVIASDDQAMLVPQNLLGLVHAPEIHRELGLSSQQVEQLESLFSALDGDWFRARVLPPNTQYATIAKLEKRLFAWFDEHTKVEQCKRLKQLELQSLGMRLLLRPEVARELALDENQTAKFAELAKSVQDANLNLQQAVMKNEVTEKIKTAASEAISAEQQALQTVLRPEQQRKIGHIVGEPFDTATLTRIYPMAPEFVPVENWINSQPFSLSDLRGKVVILHFYAFQCHNCHANFEHYNRWYQEFSSDEVVVLGIQRPETALERDVAAVRAAAKDRGMEYPIMIDLESKNWDAWANTMWPTVYVIDQNGYLRHWWQGELNWQGATGDKLISDLVRKLIKKP